MARLIPKQFRRDKRKYPIRKDEQGKSARRRCFEFFDDGVKPTEAARKIGISPKTAFHYHYQWKKLPEHLEDKYLVLKNYLKERPEVRGKIVKLLSMELGEPEYVISRRLESPWGIKQLASGKWGAIIKRKKEMENDYRYRVAMTMIDMATTQGVSIEEIAEALKKLAGEKSGEG